MVRNLIASQQSGTTPVKISYDLIALRVSELSVSLETSEDAGVTLKAKLTSYRKKLVKQQATRIVYVKKTLKLPVMAKSVLPPKKSAKASAQIQTK